MHVCEFFYARKRARREGKGESTEGQTDPMIREHNKIHPHPHPHLMKGERKKKPVSETFKTAFPKHRDHTETKSDKWIFKQDYQHCSSPARHKEASAHTDPLTILFMRWAWKETPLLSEPRESMLTTQNPLAASMCVLMWRKPCREHNAG